MSFRVKKIQTMFVSTPAGEVALSGKSGEDPELKMFTGMIEDTDDAMTNDGQMILNYMRTRSYIQGVFAYSDDDVPALQSMIEAARTAAVAEFPVNCVFTDGSIGSNTGNFVGDLIYNGTGTIELKFASAKDFIFT
jgi:hypothetical protein